jgi:short-subunit dehydrogenase
MKAKRYLITGVSSGIGYELAQRLIERGDIVWGISRRRSLLLDSKNKLTSHFFFSAVDISKNEQVDKLIIRMKKKRFVPDIVILNASIYENDFNGGVDVNTIKRVHATNFLANINIVNGFLGLMRGKGQFVAISSSSAFKGSEYEGIGYGTSKASLSLAFESLNLKYGSKDLVFTTIFLGPVNSPMRRLKSNSLFVVSIKSAVAAILKSIENRKKVYYHPLSLFIALRVLRLLPENFIYWVIKRIEKNLIKSG